MNTDLLLELKNNYTKYTIEISFCVISILCIVVSTVILINSKEERSVLSTNLSTHAKNPSQKDEQQINSLISIDISGAVYKPGIVELPTGKRLSDAIEKSGGLTDSVDLQYFYRNFNVSRIIQDQEKIYIPTVKDIQEGRFSEPHFILKNNCAVGLSEVEVGSNDSAINDSEININTASEGELDGLRGVGKVTAGKIIDGRPYTSVNDLLTKKILGKSVFDKIKSQLVVK